MKHKIKTTGQDKWVYVEDKLPDETEDNWSPDVYIRQNGRKCKGYYDHFLKLWFRIFKDELVPVSVEYWQYIQDKKRYTLLTPPITK